MHQNNMLNLTLTIRLYDPEEKNDANKAASWQTISVERDDLQLSPADFTAKYILPAIPQLEHFKSKEETK